MEYGAVDARGKILLAGLFAGLAIPAFPFDLTFAVVVELAPVPAGLLEGVLSLSGSSLGEAIDVPFEVPFSDDGAGSVGVLVGPQQVHFVGAGALVLNVLVDGQGFGRRTVLVRGAAIEVPQ